MRRFLFFAALLGLLLVAGWKTNGCNPSHQRGPEVAPPAPASQQAHSEGSTEGSTAPQPTDVQPASRTTNTSEAQAAPSAAPTPIPTEVDFRAVTRDGLSGGETTTILPGTPEQIRAMVMDFEQAADHRSFAKRIDVVSRDGNSVEAALTLKGKMGVSPKIQVRYTAERNDSGVIIRYELTKKTFGIARYQGEYVIEALPGTPARSRYTSRIFLSSGIAIAKINRADVESGQRADAGELRAWMTERLRAK